jgi:hypothetical protein
MTFLRRFLVLIVFAFWQGGFTFYAAVVVPIGRGVNKAAQEEITPSVSNWLNVSGAVALVILAWDLLPVDPVNWRRNLRTGMWSAMLLMLGALIGLHFQLVSLLTDHELFKPIHKIYLWTCTAQWAAGVVYLALTVLTWRAQDRLWK